MALFSSRRRSHVGTRVDINWTLRISSHLSSDYLSALSQQTARLSFAKTIRRTPSPSPTFLFQTSLHFLLLSSHLVPSRHRRRSSLRVLHPSLSSLTFGWSKRRGRVGQAGARGEGVGGDTRKALHKTDGRGRTATVKREAPS